MYNHCFVQDELILPIGKGTDLRYLIDKRNYKNMFGKIFLNGVLIQRFSECDNKLTFQNPIGSDIFVKSADKTKTGYLLFSWSKKPPKFGLSIFVDYEYNKSS